MYILQLLLYIYIYIVSFSDKWRIYINVHVIYKDPNITCSVHLAKFSIPSNKAGLLF